MSGRDWDRSDVRRHVQRRRRRRLRRLGGLVVLAGVVALAVAGWTAFDRRREAAKAPPVSTVPPTVPVTFPEGLRREEMAAILDQKTNLSGEEYLAATAAGALGQSRAGTRRPTSLEGYLFPATYEIGTETTVPYLVDRQLAAYDANVADIDMKFAKSKNLTPFEVLIIASMVEREVVVASERPLVAGVIYNRLKRRMRLDIDATVQYAVGDWRPLTGADLASDSPYNTRKFPGLPPGPIANPGVASIKAAAHPKQSEFLYYVAREDGTNRHYFATSIDQFEQLKAKARANAAATP